ncbi:hypothetical protein UCRPC4_g00703 [Phaeomoniella chlamydospora]|uniref:DUF7896 domain-containing protein n=1 Tax=Phaeomoniella chlamydospora TaxID=158046 RepID=A0A0G2HI57_PHACM|nr:hypothetical protein UCRPC4_g00703 [Phaeomoniella chlamydospora]
MEQYEQLGVPSTAVSEAMTRASTLSSEPMSHSSTNEMICSPLDMLRLTSNASFSKSFSEGSSLGDECQKPHDVDFISATFPINPFSPESPYTSSPQVPMFPSSSSFDTSFSSCVSSDPSPTQLSSGSLSSVPLVKSRASRRAQEQIAQSSRLIAPKVQKQTVPPPARMVRLSSEDGKVKEVAQIPKTKFQRPAKPKTFCNKCNDQPEGFHGEHELRRHMDRMHSTKRKVWVCKEKDPNGTFLANCKACRRGKTYGANYNAAAHLRRTHFHPCKKGRGGRGKPSEKRGGKGGGDDPPMDELRNWMKEIEEEVEPEGDSPNNSGSATEVIHTVDATTEAESESQADITIHWGSHPSYMLQANDDINGLGAESDVPRYQAMPMPADQLAHFFDSQNHATFDQMSMHAYLDRGYPTELSFDGGDFS